MPTQKQAFVNRLRKIDNTFIMILYPIFATAFLEVTGMELNSTAIMTITIMAIGAATSYGLENFVSIIRGGFKTNVIFPLWRSKRFWLVAVGSLSVAAYTAYPIDLMIDFQGMDIGFYEAVLITILMGIGVLSPDDLATAWQQNKPVVEPAFNAYTAKPDVSVIASDVEALG